jgi:hypothetical protein
MNPLYTDSDSLQVLHEQYIANQPFPHIVLDDFWSVEHLERAVDQLESLPEEVWNRHRDPMANESVVQRKKMGINRPEMLEGLAPDLSDIMNYLNSDQCVEWIGKLTGIENLQSDPFNQGGGIHRTHAPGKLSIHADFNIHPKTKMHRRVNILLYLNRDWQSEWHGDLELWDSKMTGCQKQVAPIFNRVVIFSTTDDALHGHPVPLACPSDRARLSLAYYYYSVDRPEKETSAPRRTKWYKRPNQQGY